MTNEQIEAATIEALHAGCTPSWLTPAAATPSPAVTEVTRLKAVVAALVDERNAANAHAEEAEAVSYDIAAEAALDAQNWREELTAMRQRLDAAEAKLAAARADLDLTCGYLDAVTNGLSVRELAIDEAALKDHPGYSPSIVSYDGRVNVIGCQRSGSTIVSAVLTGA